MCGFTGFWQTSGDRSNLGDCAHRMANALVHRGLDDEGIWYDERVGLAFGFRRLAIIDLSTAGHQPMISADGRFVAMFNGEIYNHRELRTELETNGRRFLGRSDTEVMLEAFCNWGLEE